MKTTLEELNLTERDFNILIDGLEHLSSKDAASDLMFDLLTMSLMKDDEEGKAKMKAEKSERYLQENNLLKQANQIIGQ